MPNPTPTPPIPLSLLITFSFQFLFLFPLSLFTPILAKATSYNVLHFGAKPDGITDSTRALTFRWPCSNNAISITIGGTLLAPSHYTFLGNALHWLTFDAVRGVSIHGGNVDARGSFLWNCKNKASVNCPVGAAVRVLMLHAHTRNDTTHPVIY